MTAPITSCPGTGSPPNPSTVNREGARRKTGICTTCGGRFRLGSDGLLPTMHQLPNRRNSPQAIAISRR
jgi:hypothetical protein